MSPRSCAASDLLGVRAARSVSDHAHVSPFDLRRPGEDRGFTCGSAKLAWVDRPRERGRVQSLDQSALVRLIGVVDLGAERVAVFEGIGRDCVRVIGESAPRWRANRSRFFARGAS